jgi:hypothetical protein
MFDKIKSFWTFQKIAFHISYEMAYKATLNNMNFTKKNYLLSKIFDRAAEYIDSLYCTNWDYITSGGEPIWVVELDPSDYVDAAAVIPVITRIGLVAPFVTNVINLATKDHVGYIIIIPSTFKDVDEKVKKFLIGHEIGHIESGHMFQIKNGTVSRKISREYEADLFGMKFAGIEDPSEMKRIFEEMFSIVFRTTFSSIGRLEKYNNDKDIKFFIDNWGSVQKRIQFLINK